MENRKKMIATISALIVALVISIVATIIVLVTANQNAIMNNNRSMCVWEKF